MSYSYPIQAAYDGPEVYHAIPLPGKSPDIALGSHPSDLSLNWPLTPPWTGQGEMFAKIEDSYALLSEYVTGEVRAFSAR